MKEDKPFSVPKLIKKLKKRKETMEKPLMEQLRKQTSHVKNRRNNG